MSKKVPVKICGLKTRDAVLSACDAGASYLGFNFFPKSPRYVDLETARDLAISVPPGVAKVGLVVNESDDMIGAVNARVPLDFIQLHGNETPERVREVKDLTGLPVIKALGIADQDDVAQIDVFAPVADMILVDAKPPKGSDLPGGNGVRFDWRLIANRKWTVPWMLSGGLTPDTVREAIALTGANQIDVASGVETAPGVKDADLMKAFVAAAG